MRKNKDSPPMLAPLGHLWPFPSVNDQQTEASKALQDNKALHKPQKHSLDDVEEALL